MYTFNLRLKSYAILNNMKYTFVIILTAFVLPTLTFAQSSATSGGQQTLQGFIMSFVGFLNMVVVPLLLGVAFLIFIINVVRFFVIQSNSEDGQKHAKALALYSILAFVFILIFWGVVNMLSYTFGLATGGPPPSDYQFQDQQPGIVPPARDVRPIDRNCPDGAEGLGLDGTPCGLY